MTRKPTVSRWADRRTRRLAVACVAAAPVLAAALAGCSSGGGSGSDTTLNIALVTGSGGEKALKELGKEFQAKNPHIKVNLDFLNNNGGSDIINARLKAGKIDITGGNSGYGNGAAAAPTWVKDHGGTDSTWIQSVNAKQWVDLSNESFVKDYDAGAVDALRVGGKVYEVPICQQLSSGVFYNKDVFKRVGVSVPTTWSEFVAVMAKVKAAGITPFAIGGKDVWPASIAALGPVNALYPTHQAQLELAKGLWTGQITFDSPQMLKVMDEVKTIYQNADKNFPGIEYTTAQGQFASGKAAMSLDGTWGADTYLSANPQLNLGYFAFPGSDNAAQNAHFGGRLDTTFAVPTNSPHIAQAKKFLDFVSSPSNYQTYIKLSGTIPTEPNVKVSATLASVQPALAKPFIPAWDWTFYQNPKATVSEIGFNYKNLAPMGTLPSPQAAQAATEKEWAAALKK